MAVKYRSSWAILCACRSLSKVAGGKCDSILIWSAIDAEIRTIPSSKISAHSMPISRSWSLMCASVEGRFRSENHRGLLRKSGPPTATGTSQPWTIEFLKTNKSSAQSPIRTAPLASRSCSVSESFRRRFIQALTGLASVDGLMPVGFSPLMVHRSNSRLHSNIPQAITSKPIRCCMLWVRPKFPTSLLITTSVGVAPSAFTRPMMFPPVTQISSAVSSSMKLQPENHLPLSSTR